MADNEIIKILVAEDEDVLRNNLCRMIGNEPGYVLAGAVSSGADAVAFIRDNDADIVLMDIGMEHSTDGLEAAKEIFNIKPSTAIIILTVHEDEETIFSAYCIDSIRDYVVKSADYKELKASIMKVHREIVRNNSANQKLRSEFQRLKKSEESLFASVQLLTNLTPSEREIIKYLLEGFNVRQISEKRFVSQATIKAQIGTLLKKFNFTRSKQVVSLLKQLRLEKFFLD